MDHSAAYWADVFDEVSSNKDREEAGSDAARAWWDKKAPSFAHKPVRSDYLNQLLALLDLQPGETLFDAGCGSGVTALPLAKAGHSVCAVDFSRVMLDELAAAGKRQGVAVVDGDALLENGPLTGKNVADLAEPGTVFAFQRSWQQRWDDLPKADVALSSRSLITNDVLDAIGKLEAHATDRVALTIGAGDLPYRDPRIFEAMGRAHDEAMQPIQLVALMNLLFTRGFFPRLEYTEMEGTWHRDTREELVEAVTKAHRPHDEAEAAALEAFLNEHLLFNEAQNRFELDYVRADRWAYVEWTLDGFRSLKGRI
ncbi:methyltransferase domain-containing protein [Eggerthellaceae bacterium zg-893]|nr:methyltransferase domain-containing protein [Eggerthellaceae bacterium zg-893]